MFSPNILLSNYLSQYVLSHSKEKGFVVGVIGSGGKTSAIELIASSLIKRGKSVLIITTTHMAYPSTHHYPFEVYIVADEDVKIPTKWLDVQALLVATHHGDKLGAINKKLMDNLIPLYDVILVEADGAKRMNLKYHRGDEPVLLTPTHLLLKIIGLSSLDQKIEEELHNNDLFFKEHTWPLSTVTHNLIHHLAFLDKGLRIEEGQQHTILLYNQSDALDKEELLLFVQEGGSYFKKVTHPIIVGSVHTDTIEFIINEEVTI